MRHLGTRPAAVGAICAGALALGGAIWAGHADATRAPASAQSSELARRLPRVLADLDGARVRSRALLQASRTPGDQSALARDLARAHLAAAASLRPVAGRAGAPLVASLTHAAGAYLALGRAAGGGSAPRFAAARGDVQSADARLTAALDRLARPDTVATSSSGGSPLLVPIFLLGLLAIGATLLWTPATIRGRAQREHPSPAPPGSPRAPGRPAPPGSPRAPGRPAPLGSPRGPRPPAPPEPARRYPPPPPRLAPAAGERWDALPAALRPRSK